MIAEETYSSEIFLRVGIIIKVIPKDNKILKHCGNESDSSFPSNFNLDS